MKTKQEFIQYVNKFQEWNEYWLYFIENNLWDWKYKDWKEIKTLSQTETEHILDFLYSEKKKFKLWLKTILEKTNAWNKKLIARASKKDNELEWVDYSIEYDFKDWFKFVKLISKEAYNREWKLMSHCVASYYWRDVNIYSLRDEKNLPHCTIEENNQVKGKWNQTVDNKYFWMCIKFLEYKWMTIWENEMKNIWFYKLENIDKDLSVDEKYLYDWKYISDSNLDKIKDNGWNQYEWFWLLNIKSLFEFDLNMKVKFNFDIQKIKSYFITSLKDLAWWNNSQLAWWNNSQLAWWYYS
jgi:hypothetical protein